MTMSNSITITEEQVEYELRCHAVKPVEVTTVKWVRA